MIVNKDLNWKSLVPQILLFYSKNVEDFSHPFIFFLFYPEFPSQVHIPLGSHHPTRLALSIQICPHCRAPIGPLIHSCVFFWYSERYSIFLKYLGAKCDPQIYKVTHNLPPNWVLLGVEPLSKSPIFFSFFCFHPKVQNHGYVAPSANLWQVIKS